MIEVIRPGLLTTIQDLGRPGYAHLGVPRSGALDVPSLIQANRLVGNPDGAAALETTLTGVSVRAQVATIVAVCGASAEVTVDGTAVPAGTSLPVPAGAVIEVGRARTGVRSYLAFAGGITVAPVLGSRSTDTLSTLGPPPLRPGHVFPVGRTALATDAATGTAPNGDAVPNGAARSDGANVSGGDGPGEPSPIADELVLRIRLGPRLDWISVLGRDALTQERFALSVKSNRVGARLTGPVLTRAVPGELPSEGIVLGAVQVPADGQPLIFLADHPTTGGYPVIGVVDTADLAPLAQARPGTVIRFESWT